MATAQPLGILGAVHRPNIFDFAIAIQFSLEWLEAVVNCEGGMILGVPVLGNENFGEFFFLDQIVDEGENRVGVLDFE